MVYEPADSVMSARAGGNRFVWNLRYPGAKMLKNTTVDEGIHDGPVAPPGKYQARLIVGKDTVVRTFSVVADPRIKRPPPIWRPSSTPWSGPANKINEVVESAQRIEDIQSQLEQRVSQTSGQTYAGRVDSAAKPLRKQFEAIRAELYEVGCHVDQCSLDQPMKLYNQADPQLPGADRRVSAHQTTRGDDHRFLVESRRAGRQAGAARGRELGAFNRLLAELGLPAVYVPPRKAPLKT